MCLATYRYDLNSTKANLSVDVWHPPCQKAPPPVTRRRAVETRASQFVGMLIAWSVKFKTSYLGVELSKKLSHFFLVLCLYST